MKLYWKVFLPLAFTVLLSLVLIAWIAGSVLPNHLRARQAETALRFQRSVESLVVPTIEDVAALADSMGVRIRFIPEDRQRPGRRPDPPPLPGTVIIPARHGFPYAVVGMAPVPGARLSFAVGAACMLLLLEALALHLVLKGVFTRISNLEKAASLFGRGSTSIRYASVGGDELDALGESFNMMAQRIDELLLSHKELLGSVAHELRTPLARLSLALELLREGGGSREEMFTRMEADISALDALMAELLEYNRLGRGTAPRLEAVDITELARDVIASASWGRDGLEISLSGAAEAFTDRAMLARALSNLVFNAVKYAVSRVDVVVHRTSAGFSISVADDGPGFPKTILPTVFEPFRKGADSTGAGLGLSIAQRITLILGGEISAENPAEGGARVTLAISS
jgi:signal transduction histidine kinase